MSGNFPETYVDGKGLTDFKVNSEYIINLVITLAIFFLWKKRNLLDQRIYHLVIISMVLTMIAELAFTYYVSVYGISNLVGHIFKIFSFWLIYVAVVQTTLRDPFSALSRSASTYDAIPEAVIAVDKHGFIHQANNAASQLAGLPSSLLLGKDSHRIFHPGDISKDDCQVCNAIRQNIQRDNVQMFWPERKSWLDFSVAPLKTDIGIETGMVETIRDVTKQYEAQQALANHQEHLEEMVKDRTHELEVMRDKALAASKTKSEFLAKMSHELRTPLNSIIGFTGILKDGIAGPLSNEQSKQLGMVYDSATHLLSLINDILDISKVEAGKMELQCESFDLQKTLQKVENVIRPLLAKPDKANVELVFNCHYPSNKLYSDESKIRQVLLNLLSNAVKFTNKGRVTLNCEQEGDVLHFIVHDTGIGIPEEKQSDIFESFQQADNSTVRMHEGTGLGLTITRQFVELMGGTISLESEVNVGSTFELSIPITVIPFKSEAQIYRIHSEESNLPGKLLKEDCHILVIDDDAHALELMRNYLQKEGYQVTTLSDSRQAVETVKQIKPMAITLDVQMPELDGWATLAALKSDNQTSSVPVVMISMMDKKNLGLSLGAVDYLQKPIEPERLSLLLDTIRVDNKDVLIVEDRKPDAEMLEIMLSQDGYRVRHAANGLQALDMIENHRPALILLDLMMPQMSGFEVIQRLRANKETAEIPIIVISAKHLSEAEADYLSENVEKVLVKGQLTRNDMFREVDSMLFNLCSKQLDDTTS